MNGESEAQPFQDLIATLERAGLIDRC
jgi:hypothetical protein